MDSCSIKLLEWERRFFYEFDFSDYENGPKATDRTMVYVAFTSLGVYVITKHYRGDSFGRLTMLSKKKRKKRKWMIYFREILNPTWEKFHFLEKFETISDKVEIKIKNRTTIGRKHKMFRLLKDAKEEAEKRHRPIVEKYKSVVEKCLL
jgi:hypothetical protein